MNAMCNLAGYNTANALYFNTRTTVMPSQDLCETAPLGSFSYVMLQQLRAADQESEHSTAFETLRWFCDLSVVFLQDTAAIMLLHPTRMSHPLFDMDCFHSEDFKVRTISFNPSFSASPIYQYWNYPTLLTQLLQDFLERMKIALMNEKNPVDADLERVLPGVNQ
jgi:hypothetical protein